MVVETRRGKRKENPTEEEATRVKFAKTGSRENVEKTTTEESETRAVKVVESTAKTMDESTAKMTDVSMEKTKTTEKTRKDLSENMAEMTEPFNVVAEAAPTTLNKGPGDEENEETASGDEENEETASGDEVNEKTASGDEVNEGSEEEQEKPDGEKKSSNEDHEDSEEEPLDGENEVNARSEEEQANGEGEEEANENENPLEPQLLAFEAIPKLGLAFREPVEEADVNCPRMCKFSFKRNRMTGVSLSAINKELSNTTDIDSIIPTRTPQEERLLDDILEDEDDVDESDIAVESWEKCLDAGYKVFFQDMHGEDVAARQKQAEASEAAAGDGIEQVSMLGDVMKLLKRTMRLMRAVDKKVDQLDGRLAPFEEFVKEAQAKAAEEEAPAQEKAKKQKRRKK
ncbi:hypothetical protein Bca52824_039214 [Brassica carinata]|uniref:DUF287 domain-containing protein n=1 Tax=Brassica carinata TaxID=52824 RepID=A0A8X7UUD5_BRACI|nr:hypothetical protein Bca52824_039214 [Brassica carinata]